MFEICSANGKRPEEAARSFAAGRAFETAGTRAPRPGGQERRFVVRFAFRDSGRWLCAGRGAAGFPEGARPPVPAQARAGGWTGRRTASGKPATSARKARVSIIRRDPPPPRFSGGFSAPPRHPSTTLSPSPFAAVDSTTARFVKSRPFSRPPKSTCECGKADLRTDRRYTGPSGNDRTRCPPRCRLPSNWIYRPLLQRNTP